MFRFLRYKEWDVAEMGLGPYASLLSRGETGMVGIPVFPSRMFRHSSLYLRADAGIVHPSDLAGKRIGYAEWAMTAAVYARAVLQEEGGLDLRSVQWVQGGVDQAGRVDKMNLDLPGYLIRHEPTQSLSDMLLSGELDAVISARPPAPFLNGDLRVRRAWPDFFQTELLYWKRREIFPIMHLVVIRREIYERDPWIAKNLLDAFEQAKQRSLARLRDMTVSGFPVPWLSHHIDFIQQEFGQDFWPYGIDPNLTTLDAFCDFAYEQGVCARRLKPQELFAESTHLQSRI
ncbi:MAG: ABC transporter substrate-binding protein [Pigmentiphaga sp.]|nr:ABC transporter substrate-binding protein [Pigmentiphaga sp.]